VNSGQSDPLEAYKVKDFTFGVSAETEKPSLGLGVGMFTGADRLFKTQTEETVGKKKGLFDKGNLEDAVETSAQNYKKESEEPKLTKSSLFDAPKDISDSKPSNSGAPLFNNNTGKEMAQVAARPNSLFSAGTNAPLLFNNNAQSDTKEADAGESKPSKFGGIGNSAPSPFGSLGTNKAFPKVADVTLSPGTDEKSQQDTSAQVKPDALQGGIFSTNNQNNGQQDATKTAGQTTNGNSGLFGGNTNEDISIVNNYNPEVSDADGEQYETHTQQVNED
jgi:hypothetical protein